MEKKGELLNQLAIISDLLEKLNTNTESKTIVLNLKEEEFLKAFNILFLVGLIVVLSVIIFIFLNPLLDILSLIQLTSFIQPYNSFSVLV